MNYTCRLCRKRVEELFDFFGHKVCAQCLNHSEEAMDESELYDITDRRGKEWVKEKLDELYSIETIK